MKQYYAPKRTPTNWKTLGKLIPLAAMGKITVDTSPGSARIAC
jgi:hypothetical protein